MTTAALPTSLNSLPEEHNSSKSYGEIGQNLRRRAGQLVDILGQKLSSPFVRLSKAIKEHARKNIGRANDKVEETKAHLEYLKSVREYIEKTIKDRLLLIKSAQIALERERSTTQENMQKLHGEIAHKKFWSFPGKKASLKKSYETLAKTLAAQNQKAHVLEMQHAGLEVTQRQIHTLASTIQREESYLQTLTSTLNPTTPPDTITGLRGIATSFAKEHSHILALSTIHIGNLGMQLMHTYHTLEKNTVTLSPTF